MDKITPKILPDVEPELIVELDSSYPSGVDVEFDGEDEEGRSRRS